VLKGESLSYQENFNAMVNAELYTLSMPNGASLPSYISVAYTTAVQSQTGQTTTDTTWQK